MARSPIPDPLTRRHLIERDLTPAQAQKIVDAYLAEGRSVEAVEFLRKAESGEGLAALRRESIAQGDVFLLRAVSAATGEAPGRDEWLTLAEAAAAAGKERYAAEARRYADRGEG